MMVQSHCIVGGEGMIRVRVPSLDDLYLYRLVVKRLVPLSRITQPELRLGKKTVLLRLAKSKVYVAAKRGQPPFGFISLKIKQRVLFIDLLAVDSSGENKGWGSKLMRTGEDYGKKMGCDAAKVFVDEQNEHAQTFYKYKGYEMLDYIPLIHCYLLGKNL
jgi:ribosomal protein S18 acetylase RimI-like enzyme